jgi:glycosyltransferase involved in cell wall biosynthesis
MNRRYKLAALVSHPIQYMVPLFKKLAQRPEIDLTVFYMTEIGVKPTNVVGMGEAIVWDTPVLEGYRYEFLPNLSPAPNGSGVHAKVNPAMLARLVRDRPDALYMHGFASVTELATISLAKLLRIPVLFHGDTNLVSETERPALARTAFRRAFCASIDAALVMSSRARQYYEHNGVPSSRMFWAPLAVDNDHFIGQHEKLAPRRAALKAELQLPADLPVVVSVINFRPSKRPMDLIQASERMARPASFLIIGDGPLRAECQDYVRSRGLDNVHMPGNRNQSQLPPYYTVADVFALPSSYDLNPLVVREAMCFSLPVVLSDGVQSSIDFLREGENGLGYPKTDVARLAACLDDVLADPERTRRMGAASLELIRPWNHDVSVEAVLSALRALVPVPA